MANDINRTLKPDSLLNNQLFVQYSHDIDFDYSGGKYPNGTEAAWDWENVLIPVTHKLGNKTVAGHTWRRERIGNTAWGLPTRMVASTFKIDASGQTVPSPENLIEGYTFLNESTGQIYIVKNSEWTGPFDWRGQTSGIFYKQDTQPNGLYVGDTWNNTSNDTLWRFDGTSWVLIELSGSVQDLALGELSNVVLTNSTTGEVLMFNGTNWTNQVIDSYPDQTGNNGKFLQTDGTDVSWQEIVIPEITASNGLTKTLDNIELGGIVSDGVDINVNGQYFGVFDNSTGNLQSLYIDNSTVTMYSENSNLTKNSSITTTDGIASINSINNSSGFSASLEAEPTFVQISSEDSNDGSYAKVLVTTANTVNLISSNGTNIVSHQQTATPLVVANNGNDNNIVITDNISAKGIVYATDYSANFTPESLITKRYADTTFVEDSLLEDNIWVGNASNLPTATFVKKSLSGVTNLVAGSVNIADAAITASSIVYCSVGDGTYNGKIRYSANIGYVTFYTGDVGDNADVSYMIINP